LKLHRETAHIPIIVSTAALQLSQELDAYVATREVTLLPKPFTIDELLAVVRQALSSSNVRRSVYQPME
jgi:CheY-like chemotaxis protein